MLHENYKNYKVRGRLELADVLPLIPSDNKVVFFGLDINVKSLRLRTFKKYGVDCVTCGAKGSYFLVAGMEKSKLYHDYHLCLIAIAPDGSEVMMTKDHRLPRSKGGKDYLGNMQPLCSRCNARKGSLSMDEFLLTAK